MPLVWPWRSESKSSTVMGWEALVDLAQSTAADISVSPDRALRCAPVFAGVRVRCEVLASLPAILYERRADQGKDRATDHPLFRLIHDRPNPWTSTPEFVAQMEQDTITHGAGYALANRSGDKIVELIRLAPGSVTEACDQNTLEPGYKVTLKNGGQRTYRWQDILHVPALGGMSAIKQCRDAIGLCAAMERHAGQIFGNGARPSGVLKTKGRLTDPRFEQLKRSWNSAHSGENSGKTAILEDGTEFQPLTFNSVDLQFQELRAFQVIEIARALAVPPTLIFDFSRATWANAESMSLAFLTYTILPRVKIWQGAMSRLLSAEDQKKFFPEFMVDELVKAEIAARFEAYAKAITNGILNPNEVRSMENRAPYAGGDEFRVAMNTEVPGRGTVRISRVWAERGRHPTWVFTYVAQRNWKPSRRAPDGLIKGERYPVTYAGLTSHHRRAWVRAGVKARYHDLRHTAGMRTLRSTGNLKVTQKLLGHSDIATTSKFYVDALVDDVREAMETTAQKMDSRKESRTSDATPVNALKKK
jgi:HK97 family phage portal protein